MRSCREFPPSKPDMAKRSDFAQKLLDDLRLRKERMAAASQTSNRSKTTTIDAYAYSKQIHRGSKNSKTHGVSVPKTGNVINTRYGGGNKSLMTNDNSNQIVPYTRGQNSEQIGDLSMALAFALENGGKLRGNSSSGNNLMLGFLQQIGRRSFEIGKMNKRGGLDRNHNATGYFPTISHLHIKEISKGAQKLNQILRTCSNDSDFGRCSIEIGQKLLKGAMDLEESLRMLVNLHEASEHMISPQQKNRIVLLENEEDEEKKDETLDQKLYQPRFSLDKLSLNSRSSQEVKGNGHNQKLATLRYTAEGGNFNHEEQPLTTVKLSFHRRSATCGNDVKISNTREKVGISNVIAKLMGLDNLSDNSNYAHKDSGCKQKVTQKDLQPSTTGITRKNEPRSNITESRSNFRNPKPIISDKNSAGVNRIFVSPAMNDFPTNDASLRAITFSGKPSWKGIEGIRPQTSPSTPTITIFKQQQNRDEMGQRVPNQKDHLEGLTKQIQIKHREQKGTDREEHREVLKKGLLQKDYREVHMKHHHQKHMEVNTTERDQKKGELKNRVQQMEAKLHKKSEHAIIVQGYKERTFPLVKRHPDKLQSRMQQQSPNSPKYQQPPMRHKAEMGDMNHHIEEKKQKNGKQAVQERNQKRTGIASKSLTKPVHDTFTFSKKQQDMNHVRQGKKSCKETITAHLSYALPNNRSPENQHSRENKCYDLNDKTSEITHNSVEQGSSPRGSDTILKKEPVMEKQHAKEPVKNELQSTKTQKSGGLIINEVYAMKQQSPTLQEVEQEQHENFDALDGPKAPAANGSKEVEAHLFESRETVVSIQPLTSTPDSHEEANQVLTSPIPDDGECLSLKEPQISAPNDNCQKTISISTSNKQDQRSVFDRGEINSSKIVINAVEDSEQYNMNTLYPPHLEHLHSKSRKQETLTESENHLKQMLITSEWFLNAAEALFKLNIPSFILHDSGHHSHLKNGRNFTIDCSYELMKRKGIWQELNNRPGTHISLRSKKIESLDDLIKQLHRDMEALKLYGRNGNPECEVQDYLPKMLESDIYNQEPDFNSMWDLGWNETTFVFIEKEEVVRDVEKHVLSGLLDEVTRDLVYVCHLLTKRRCKEI